MKNLVAVISISILLWSCDEEVPEQYCVIDFSTPPSVISKFDKWKISSYFKGFNIGYYCSNSDCYKSQVRF